jgi:hypothetical protein
MARPGIPDVAVRGVGDAADVHELHEDATASRVSGGRDLLPRGNLFRRVN